MSNERELLEELSTKNMVSYYYPNLIDRIKELLEQPEQEPVVWQYRKWASWQNHLELSIQRKWENCTKESYENYKSVPLLHDWHYEVRELYTSPTRESKSDDESYYQRIKEHKQQCEDDFINHQYREDDE